MGYLRMRFVHYRADIFEKAIAFEAPRLPAEPCRAAVKLRENSISCSSGNSNLRAFNSPCKEWCRAGHFLPHSRFEEYDRVVPGAVCHFFRVSGSRQTSP